MGTFFKGIGKGLYNIVIIPVWLVGLLLSAVAGFVVFFWELFKQIGRFFTGKNLSLDLPEDIQAKKMLAPKVDTEETKEKQDDVEVVVAEIADPGTTYKQVEIEPEPEKEIPKHIETNEDVDFVINEGPIEIEFPNTMPQVRNSFNEEPLENTREKVQEPAKEPEEEPKEEEYEEYSPKGSDF